MKAFRLEIILVPSNQQTCKSDDMALRPIALHRLLTLATPSSVDSAIRMMAWHHSCTMHSHFFGSDRYFSQVVSPTR